MTNWNYSPSPENGDLCWVACKDATVRCAFADKYSANGWTNHDTWEDFDREVVAWTPMELPTFPANLTEQQPTAAIAQ